MTEEAIREEWGTFDIMDWELSLQVKRNKETGAHLRDKARHVPGGTRSCGMGSFRTDPSYSPLVSRVLRTGTS